ncbi:MAG: hypothetical protein PHS14_04180 [Elusimicrobia bacterium]|nr:hypothetical protein [Elusimicrobiota bacterium]
MVMAERVCAWCGASLGSVEGDFDPAYLITHGICAACGCALVQAGDEIPAQDFLDRLSAPVLLVDADGRALAASRRARELLGKEFPPLAGFKSGTVIDCVNSNADEGCGGAVLCRSRVISRAVAETYETGRACVDVPAYPDAQDGQPLKNARLKITTEKVGECVTLRIDE